MLSKQGITDIFKEHYSHFSKFPDEYPQIWDLCLSTASDPALMTGICFANDYLLVPPVKSFLCCQRQALQTIFESENIVMDATLKRSIGAFWGAVFKWVLGYLKQEPVAGTVKGFNVKMATRYWDQHSDGETGTAANG